MTNFDTKIDYISAALTTQSKQISPTLEKKQERTTREPLRAKPLRADDCSFYETAGPDKARDGIYSLNGLKDPKSGQVRLL